MRLEYILNTNATEKVLTLIKEVFIMPNTLTINPGVLLHYVNNAEIPYEILQEKCKYIDLFLSGAKQPTFKQLSEVAKKLNVPTGLLLLPTPINVEASKLEFRTVGSNEIGRMSDNLRDTITDMEKKQDFLRDMLEAELSFIGSISIKNDIEITAEYVRSLLKIPTLWQGLVDDKSDAFKFFRSRINSMGTFVFVDGIARQNTKRTFDTNEFRGFTLLDKKAPIIFINSTDSDAGRLFTLIHEFVHLLLGSSGIVNKIYLDSYAFSPVETFANKVTAEILVPSSVLLNNSNYDISKLSREFKVSEYVIARRLLDFNIMTSSDYQVYVRELTQMYESKKSVQKKSTGGNYYNNVKFKIDNSFFHTVKNAIYTDKITYTQAFDILGLSQKVFKKLEGEL